MAEKEPRPWVVIEDMSALEGGKVFAYGPFPDFDSARVYAGDKSASHKRYPSLAAINVRCVKMEKP